MVYDAPVRTDRELVDAVLRESPPRSDAATELVDRLRPWVVGLAIRRFSLSEPEAEEMFQTLVVRLFENDRRALRSWRGEARLTTWVSVVAARLCVARRSEAGPPTAPEEEAKDLPAPEAEDPVVAGERLRAVRSAVAELAPRDRLLLALRYVDERSPREIAATLGLRPGTARKALHDARRRLRDRILELSPELFDDRERDRVETAEAGTTASQEPERIHR